jgi:hypothetical protein
VTVLLLFIACFQFLATCIGLQQSPAYFALNPYVTLAPFLAIWMAGLAFYKLAPDKNFTLLWLLVAGIQIMVVGAYQNAADFPFNFIRSLQFFWGPALLTPMLLGLFRMTAHPLDPVETTRGYIRWLCIITSAITFIEVFLVWGLHIPPTALPWVQAVYSGPHRPFGLATYPQPNAVLLAMLFWLSFLYEVKGNWHRVFTAAALAITLGGTGVITFLALAPLWSRKPFMLSAVAAIGLVCLVATATMTSQYATSGLLWKLDWAYLQVMAKIFSGVFSAMLAQFTQNDILMGSQIITPRAATGLTHDWAYFDVFYVSGLIGLFGYVALYSVLVFLATPAKISRSMRLYFAMIVMIANFHYGTLNYFIGQAFISTLAALNIYRTYIAKHASVAVDTNLVVPG